MTATDDRWLVGRLRDLVAEDPDRKLYVELGDGENETGALTAAELAARAAEVSARLSDLGAKPGDRAIVFDGGALDTLVAFFGCLATGVSPVVLPPPGRPEHIESRLLPVTQDARPIALLARAATNDTERALVDQLVSKIGSMISLGDLSGDVDAMSLPDQPPHPRAFMQFTSGSTAAPRGVMVEHTQLLANLEMLKRSFDWNAESVLVGWNPLSHDMGLIVGALPAVAFGLPVVLMPPQAFILQPGRWLRAISKFGGTHGCAPNFGYDLCIDRVKPAEREALDLSSWRVAVNGAEPVRELTRRRFLEAYTPHGFRPEAWCPGYGMAEATVFVSASAPEVAPRTTWLDRSALADGRVVEVEPDGDEAVSVVGCGVPALGLEVIAVDPDTRRRVPEDLLGELWLRGPSIASGYFERPEDTEEIFGGVVDGEDDGRPWLRSGDLGFIRGGEVHIVGRAKDVVITHGRNLHASDVELAATDAHPVIRRGGVIAFSVDTGEKEKLVVVAEVKGAPDRREVAAAIRQAVFTSLEVPVSDVFLTVPRGVPKTTSGKLQRSECRRLYLEGALVAPEEPT